MQRLKQLAVSDEGFLFDPATGESYVLNASALTMLRALQAGQAEDDLVEHLRTQCAVDAVTARRDVADFLSRLKSLNLV